MAGLLDYVYGKEGQYGLRPDGTMKGNGYFGPLKMINGQDMTELTGEMDGVSYPIISPALSKGDLLSLQLGMPPNRQMYFKSFGHALKRMQQGMSPYADLYEGFGK